MGRMSELHAEMQERGTLIDKHGRTITADEACAWEDAAARCAEFHHDWQPIETAPKQFPEWILLWKKGFADPVRGRWYPVPGSGGYFAGNDFEGVHQFTHWMPLPEPPK